MRRQSNDRCMRRLFSYFFTHMLGHARVCLCKLACMLSLCFLIPAPVVGSYLC